MNTKPKERINLRGQQAGKILSLWYALHEADRALTEVRKHVSPAVLRKTKPSYAAFQKASKGLLGPN